MSDDSDLLDSLVLGSARGGKAGPALECHVVRELTAEDLPKLVAPAAIGALVPTLLNLRTSHHQVAQLLAKGEAQQNIALITGYSPSYISNLKRDPAFVELVAHYSAERELIFADTIEQCRVLGLNFKEELQQRLESDPAQFTAREVMDAMKLLLVDMRPQAVGGKGAGGGDINIQVSFETQAAGGARPEIEVEFREVDADQ